MNGIIKISMRVSLLLVFLLSAQWGYAQVSSPVNMLQQISDQSIAQLKKVKATLPSDKTVPTTELHKIIKTYLLPHVQLDLMSRAVIGRTTWENATAVQKAEFKTQFTDLVINTYSTALKTFDKNKIVFYNVRGGYEGKTIIQVNSVVQIPDTEPLPVVYHLILEKGNWYITDLSVEGISLVSSYQAQFTPIIAEKGMSGLISLLKENNAKLSQ